MSLSRDIAEAYRTLVHEGQAPERAAEAVVSFLSENGLGALSERVIEHVAFLEEEERLYQTVSVHVADSGHAVALRHIAQAIAGNPDVAVETHEDKELIGGFKARYRGREWDASVAGALTRLRAKLKQQ